MPPSLTQLDCIRGRFDAACGAFMADGGRELLQLKADGGATEQRISGALALHLRSELRDFIASEDVVVDAEYFYDGDDAKMMAAMGPFADIIERARRRMRYDGRVGIRPDIIVHRRGPEGPNYFVIEVKKRSNGSAAQTEFDLLKLRMMTSPEQKYRYIYGFQVRAFDSDNAEERKLEVLSTWHGGKQVA
jgi:hypothetical protein